jgi:TRAP-type mannitol/chloroaromatic compound transport system substrate-binding protein
MKRRQFLQAGAAVAATGIAAPAIAQGAPEIRWRLSSAFPKSLDTLFGASEGLSRYVAEMTEGRFTIQPFAPGEIVGTPQLFDAISTGTVEMGHTASYYYFGKDPTFALFTAMPFGPNARQQNAWFYTGGGNDMANEFFAKHNVYALPGGNTGTQMGGFFRKEIKTVEDLKGLKFRIAGLAGQILAKVGVVPQQIPGGDIYPALERGTIDAAEWVGPYDDERLGFVKVAPYYYFPGFWEGGAAVHFMFNRGKWNELPKHYQAVLRSACAHANVEMLSRYDAWNPGALRKLVGQGAQLRAFTPEVMDVCLKAATEVYEEISGKNADFKKIHDSLRQARNEGYLWQRVSELSYDTYMAQRSR